MKLAGTPVHILTEAYESRCARNAHYSLRAFARDLGISNASLCLILKQKQGLSIRAAERIAQRLGFNPAEKEYFCDLVQSHYARSESDRRIARIKLRKYDAAGTSLDLERFKAVSDWYHFAILELAEIPGFRLGPQSIARALGIPPKAAALAVERLKKLKLLAADEQDGRLERSVGFVATPSGIPSATLKKHHTQLLEKAKAALYTQTVEERDFSAMQFAMSREDLGWAKEQIRAFRRTLMERLQQNPMRDRVYCLAIQLFGLQQNGACEVHAPETIIKEMES